MRTAWLAAVLIAILGCASEPVWGQDKKEAPKQKQEREGPALQIGDSAPALKVTKWLKGDKISDYERGKVYVLEFWATWCGPCVSSMPHLSDLQALYRDKGVAIVGLTSDGHSNSAEKVDRFVKERGAQFDYAFAFCSDNSMSKAFMEAAEQDGIPCSFVIDQAGKIAYIGHPMDLDDVLPKILDGTWRGKGDILALEREQKAFFDIVVKSIKDPKGAAEDLKAFETKHPQKLKAGFYALQKLIILLRSDQLDEAATLSQSLVDKNIAVKNEMDLAEIASELTAPKVNTNQKTREIAIKAIENALQLGDGNHPTLALAAASVYFLTGETEKAEKYGAKAVKAFADPEIQKSIEDQLKAFRDRSKAPKTIPSQKTNNK